MDAAIIDSFYYSARNHLFPKCRLSNGNASIHQVELDHAFVRYQQVGWGQRTIVLCPDLPNTIEHNQGLIERLQSCAQVICIEMPGQGFSFPKKGFRFSLSDYAAVLTELLDRLHLRHVVLEAPCLYSFAALNVAHRRPDLVKKLVFTQTPSLIEEQAWCRFVDFNNKKILHRPVLGQLLMLIGQSFVTKRWYHYAQSKNGSYDRYLKTTLAAYQQGACFCLASLFQKFQDWRLPSNLFVKQDVVAVWGLADRSHQKTKKDSLLLHAPQTKIVAFEECGHFPELDRSEDFSKILLEA